MSLTIYNDCWFSSKVPTYYFYYYFFAQVCSTKLYTSLSSRRNPVEYYSLENMVLGVQSLVERASSDRFKKSEENWPRTTITNKLSTWRKEHNA